MFIKYRFTPSPALGLNLDSALYNHLFRIVLLSESFQAYSYCPSFLTWTSKVGLSLFLFELVRYYNQGNLKKRKKLRSTRLKMTLRITFLVPFRAPRQDQLFLCYNITAFSILFLKTSQHGAFTISSGNISQCFNTLIIKGDFLNVYSEYSLLKFQWVCGRSVFTGSKEMIVCSLSLTVFYKF